LHRPSSQPRAFWAPWHPAKAGLPIQGVSCKHKPPRTSREPTPMGFLQHLLTHYHTISPSAPQCSHTSNPQHKQAWLMLCFVGKVAKRQRWKGLATGIQTFGNSSPTWKLFNHFSNSTVIGRETKIST